MEKTIEKTVEERFEQATYVDSTVGYKNNKWHEIEVHAYDDPDQGTIFITRITREVDFRHYETEYIDDYDGLLDYHKDEMVAEYNKSLKEQNL